MKMLIRKTSDDNYKKLREYKTLDDCINHILDSDAWQGSDSWWPEVIVSRPSELEMLNEGIQCDYVVEIYDTYRELKI